MNDMQNAVRFQAAGPVAGRLPAFTLLESMVATVLITVSFLTGMLVFGQVMTGDSTMLRTQANNLLLEALEKTRSNPGASPAIWRAGDLVLRRTIKIFPETAPLTRITLTASAGDREIARIDALLWSPVKDAGMTDH